MAPAPVDRRTLGGVLAMVPGFAKPDAADIRTVDTVDEEALAAAVDRIISDGVDVLATTGSFGEGYALLPMEYERFVKAAVGAVDGRVPLFAGCVGAGARDIFSKVETAASCGVAGVLVGLPNYFPMTAQNAVAFLGRIAEEWPELAVLIYHNPALHRTAIPIAAVVELSSLPNVVGMKDTHRDVRAFVELRERWHEPLAMFVSAAQYHAYASLGAAGFWSYDCWMDPWPVTAYRDAVRAGDDRLALKLVREMTQPYEGPEVRDLRWRETAAKLSIAAAGYCHPGPLRAPFVHIPEDVHRAAEARARHWRGIRGRVEAEVGAWAASGPAADQSEA